MGRLSAGGGEGLVAGPEGPTSQEGGREARGRRGGLALKKREQFRRGCLQVTRPAALLKQGDSLAWQSFGDGFNLVSGKVGNPTRMGRVVMLHQQAVNLHCLFPRTLVSQEQHDRRQCPKDVHTRSSRQHQR